MSLIADGRNALRMMLEKPELFGGVPARDWSSVAIRLAKRQINAGKQSREDILAIRNALGEDMFNKTLDALSAHHMKLLAKRIDQNADPELLKTSAMALMHIRTVLSDDWTPGSAAAPTPANDPIDAPKKPNPYIGRKAFRTGR